MLEKIKAVWPMVSTALTLIIVPFTGWLWRKHKQTEQRQRALELGVQALLRDRIVQAYYHYTEKGWMTLHGREAINAMYKQYHALGGNGTVTELVNVLRALPVLDDNAVHTSAQKAEPVVQHTVPGVGAPVLDH